MTSVGCGPAPAGEYTKPLMSTPWLGMCSTVIAAGCAWSAGGSVHVAGRTSVESAAHAGPTINSRQPNTERMVTLSTIDLVPRCRGSQECTRRRSLWNRSLGHIDAHCTLIMFPRKRRGGYLVQLYTVGHSNHPIEKFIGLLTANGITAVADVRSRPFSRRHPQFNKERLAAQLM